MTEYIKREDAQLKAVNKYHCPVDCMADILAADVIDRKSLEEASCDFPTLADWYISSVDEEPPVWTEEHIKELLEDFYVIPRTDTQGEDNV